MTRRIYANLPQWTDVLIAVYFLGRAPTLTQISKEVGILVQQSTHHINALEEKGYVTSVYRSKYRYVSITEKGVSVADVLVLLKSLL